MLREVFAEANNLTIYLICFPRNKHVSRLN